MAIGILPGAATANLNNAAAHGFSEILYTYSSGAGNNAALLPASTRILLGTT